MRYAVSSLVFVLATSVAANAQTASERLQLQRIAATAGEVVILADDGGGSVRGRLIGASDSILELETRSGRKRFDMTSVARVERSGDSIVNGVLRGMGVASVWCTLACEANSKGSPRGSAYIGRVALGGLIGGAIDRRFNTSRPIYRRRPAPEIHLGVGRPGVSVLVAF